MRHDLSSWASGAVLDQERLPGEGQAFAAKLSILDWKQQKGKRERVILRERENLILVFRAFGRTLQWLVNVLLMSINVKLLQAAFLPTFRYEKHTTTSTRAGAACVVRLHYNYPSLSTLKNKSLGTVCYNSSKTSLQLIRPRQHQQQQ